ncbi:hypothetical protein DL95DRAFT_394079 [Leptodontidium sp. 2 PMI_412]|nr:hypothetical protein DL95DRAFT_394079 [Leptodontidium sp. 2 PMI_412]
MTSQTKDYMCTALLVLNFLLIVYGISQLYIMYSVALLPSAFWKLFCGLVGW